MKTRIKYAMFALAVLLIVSMVVCGEMVLPSQALSATITVTGTTDGITATHIGATEASSRFDTADLLDLGINTYRMWGSAAQTEPVDDDGVYGSPSIADIKADPDIIPWSVWETNLHDVNWRPVSLYDQLLALKNADIAAVVSLINVNNKDEPAWMLQLNPPQTTEDWNEWWQHVFAMVYVINVRNDLDVHDWQVLNEPDNLSQGWGGTLADYITFTQYTADAIHYVYDTYLPGETPRIYAAETVHANEWVQESVMYNDDIVDVYDWHNYGNNGTAEAEIVHGWMDLYDTDGVHEEFYLSEWGSYSEVYNDPPSARQFAYYLIAQSQNTVGHIDGGAIFSMYRWTGGCMGLIEADGTRTLTYYTLRNVIRGLQGGRQQYTTTGVPSKATAIAAVDEATDTLYLTIENIGGGTKDYTITLDVSAHTMTGTASVYLYKYETNTMDELVATPDVVNGQVIFDMPELSLVSVVVSMGEAPPPTDTPEPQPTDTPGGPTDTPAPPTDTPEPGGAMHIGDISFSTRTLGAFKKVKALVTIVDAGSAPVGTATVYGDYSGVTSASVNAITAGDGVATMPEQSDRNGGTWTFCVTDVVKSGWTYDDTANVETCDSITYP